MPPATKAPSPPTPHAPACSYRPEIDGLRAVAILLVLGFHAFPDSIPGGFLGVDMFFVISGYLITQMVWSTATTNDWNLATFYLGRIRRLFPSLLVVITAALAGGWCFMFPDEYSRLGNNVFMTALFISNFELMRETGYFSPDASSNPLLHLWSLGIEEQFYLFWPIVLAVACRRSVSPKLACWTLLICSLAYSAATASSNSTVFFYSPLTRSWELLIGAALALHSSTARSKLAANVAASSGIFLIITAAFLLSKASVFPTALGLLPTIGTALILWAGLRARISASILSRGPMVALGIISYPLYLWHWVLFSYAGMLHGSATTTYLRVFLIGLSLLLAWLTYFYVERPFRFGRLKPHAPALLLAIMSLCAFSGHLVSRLNGIPERRTEREREFLDFFENDAPGCQYFLRVGLFKKWRTECAFFNLAPDLAGSPVENRRKHPYQDINRQNPVTKLVRIDQPFAGFDRLLPKRG